METIVIIVIVAVAAYCVRYETIKLHRRSIQRDIERSLMKSYKPFTKEEKARWQQIMKEIDEE